MLHRVVAIGALLAACSHPTSHEAIGNRAAPSADAEPKSWAALRGSTPANADTVFVLNLRALRATPSFEKLVAGVPMLADAVSKVKTLCGVDPLAAITDITMVRDDRDGVVAFGLDGIDEAKLLDCGSKLKHADHPKGRMELAAKQGKLLEYQTHDSETEHLFATWPAEDVVAFAIRHDRKDAIEALLAAKAPSGELAAAIGKGYAPGALAWGAFVSEKRGPATGNGSVALARSTVAFHLDLTVGSAAEATEAAEKLRKQRVGETEHAGPVMTKVLNALQVRATGSIVTLDVSFDETDLPEVFKELALAMI